ncbi:PadR family transcriptional regulator [Paraburkholderia sp. SG-MS1]|uniref:PadR family transcriptional regulator n=1 Tax=Paraburkholderia sp. SG-MS1 TaxID=2023741 RepID=UPI001EEA4C91|nr:PadR family transcriptional regulator [Paraburkholderia sp. SG-MS1]
MRHPHRFSHPRSAAGGFDASPERTAFRELWHAFIRDQAQRGERGGAGFERRHGGRGDWHAHSNAQGRGERHDFSREEAGRRGERGERGPRGERKFHGHTAGHPGRREPHADAREHGPHGRRLSPQALLWHAIGRHQDPRGGGRGGRFGGGPGGFGGDGEGFPRGRKFSSDDLQLLLLSMIDAQPSHGYELIKALEMRSNGFYSPSPGMVYPALTYLEELGYVTVQLEGNRKRYELAHMGRDYLAANRERVELMLAKLTHIARKMDSVRRALAGEEPADISEGGWLPELNEARRTLKHALLRRDNVPADEQRRIAAILMRAAREIEGAGSESSGGEAAV